MLTSSAKSKGRALAKWLKDALLQRFEHLQPDDLTVTPSGVTGGDLTQSPAATSVLPYQWECKSHARFAGYAFFDQAYEHGDREPVVIVRANHRRPLAIIDAEHFLDLLKCAAIQRSGPSV